MQARPVGPQEQDERIMHVYSHLFRGLGQTYSIRQPGSGLTTQNRLFQFQPPGVPLTQQIIPGSTAPRLRTPPYWICPGSLSWYVDHTHAIYANLTEPTVRLLGTYGSPGIVYVAQRLLRQGAVRITTTLDNGHVHDLQLTAEDAARLLAGGNVKKETTRNARPGGTPHTHTVSLFCSRRHLSSAGPAFNLR
jgi:hypothetical protein